MALPIKDFEISKTFKNVILSTISGSDDTDGVPAGIPASQSTPGTGQSSRAQGKLQDGFGKEIPMILSTNYIEVTARPETVNSVTRLCDLRAIQAQQYINNIIWS